MGVEVFAKESAIGNSPVLREEYIAFIDEDDYILPDYYTHLYGLITDNQADMAMCKHLVVDSDGLAVPALLFSTGIREGVYTGKDIFDKGFLVYVWGKLFKRELCLKYRFPENRQIVEDTLWLCCLLPDCSRVSVSRKRMYRYTRHRDSASHEMLYALNEKKMNDIMEASMELYRYFKALRIIW